MSEPMPVDLTLHIRELYDMGASVAYIKRKYALSRSELQDILPDAFKPHPTPESDIGGY